MSTKMTVDGNTAVGHVAYAFSDVAATISDFFGHEERFGAVSFLGGMEEK